MPPSHEGTKRLDAGEVVALPSSPYPLNYIVVGDNADNGVNGPVIIG